jgi:hypothetical protein
MREETQSRKAESVASRVTQSGSNLREMDIYPDWPLPKPVESGLAALISRDPQIPGGDGGGGDTPDDFSIDRNDDLELQEREFDDAPAHTAVPDFDTDYIQFRDADSVDEDPLGAPTMMWVLLSSFVSSIASYIIDVIWGGVVPGLIDDHGELAGRNDDDHATDGAGVEYGPLNTVDNVGTPYMALGRYTDQSIPRANVFARNTRNDGQNGGEDNHLGESLRVEKRIIASDDPSTGGFAVSDHADSPTEHLGLTSAKKLRLPCADGTVVECYLRGGILCAD